MKFFRKNGRPMPAAFDSMAQETKAGRFSRREFLAMASAMGDTLALTQADSLCPVVPMFHVNALFYSLGGALAAGATLLRLYLIPAKSHNLPADIRLAPTW